MATLPGWSRVGGSSNRYLDPSGNEVSYRTYLNEKSRREGYGSFSERVSERQREREAGWVGTIAFRARWRDSLYRKLANDGIQSGKLEPADISDPSSDFNQRMSQFLDDKAGDRQYRRSDRIKADMAELIFDYGDDRDELWHIYYVD